MSCSREVCRRLKRSLVYKLKTKSLDNLIKYGFKLVRLRTIGDMAQSQCLLLSAVSVRRSWPLL